MDFRYKPGDAVRVRSDLKYGADYWMRSGPKENDSALIAVDNMINFAGKTVHISEYSQSDEYRIKEDGERWRWTDEMFDGLATDIMNFQSLL